MKRLLSFLLLLFGALSLQAQQLKLAPNSTLFWRGANLIGQGHEGTIQFSSGWLSVSPDGIPLKGEFEVDLNTLQNTDIRDVQGKADLEQHLKSADFFDVDKFKKAMFQITAVKPDGTNRYQITGFLAIKGIINSITLPAEVIKLANGVHVKAKFQIDRTKWGVNYQSKTIFADIKDGIISDNVTLEMNLHFLK